MLRADDTSTLLAITPWKAHRGKDRLVLARPQTGQASFRSPRRILSETGQASCEIHHQRPNGTGLLPEHRVRVLLAKQAAKGQAFPYEGGAHRQTGQARSMMHSRTACKLNRPLKGQACHQRSATGARRKRTGLLRALEKKDRQVRCVDDCSNVLAIRAERWRKGQAYYER